MTQTLKIVKLETLYETIHSYITESSKKVTNYEEMIEVVLEMIKDGHCFVMDRDILRDALESLTFMYEPNDDMNKDRVILQLVDIDDDEDDEDIDGDASMDMLKNLGKMMGMPDMSDMPDMDDKDNQDSVEESAPVEEPAPTPVEESAPVEEPAPTPVEESAPAEDQ